MYIYMYIYIYIHIYLDIYTYIEHTTAHEVRLGPGGRGLQP